MRRLASFAAVAVSVFAGLLTFARLGNVDNDGYRWLLTRLTLAGMILAGLVLLLAAVTAVHRPRRAGWILLIGTPVLGFLLAYPDAGYLVWDQHGAGIFEQPFFTDALIFSSLFYLPFILAVLLRRHRKRARWVFFISAVVVIPLLAWSHWAAAMASRLAAISASFALLGGFWLWTSRRGWPPLRLPRVQSRWRRAGFAVGAGLVASLLVIAATLGLAVVQSSTWTADCRGDYPFLRPVSERHVALTAHILWAGWGLRAQGHPVGDWAIARIEERFWGYPSWAPPFVLLRNSLFEKGQTVFVSAHREWAVLARHLPIIDAESCGDYYTRRVDLTRIQLGLLRQSPAAAGALILGVVRSPVRWSSPPRPRRASLLKQQSVYEWAFHAPPRDRALAHTRVRISSAERTAIVTTDADGFFEWRGPRADDYVISVLDVPAAQMVPDVKVSRTAFASGFAALPIQALWNGRIEGLLEDTDGNPVRPLLQLTKLDGSSADDVNWFGDVSVAGRFDVPHVPPGRYKLLINVYGPTEDAPYPRMYFPRVLEITGTNQIVGLRIVVNRLIKRTLAVSVRMSDGPGAPDAGIHLEYEGPEYDKALEGSISHLLDNAGNAFIPVFGDTRIRVQAFSRDANRRRSERVELDTTELPERLNLTLTRKLP